jgi:hypothetical protein
MYFSCFIGVTPSHNEQVLSSYFGIVKEKDIESVVTVARETSQLSCALFCMEEPKCTLASFGQDSGVCLMYGKKQKMSSSAESGESLPRNPEFINFKKVGQFCR